MKTYKQYNEGNLIGSDCGTILKNIMYNFDLKKLSYEKEDGLITKELYTYTTDEYKIECLHRIAPPPIKRPTREIFINDKKCRTIDIYFIRKFFDFIEKKWKEYQKALNDFEVFEGKYAEYDSDDYFDSLLDKYKLNIYYQKYTLIKGTKKFIDSDDYVSFMIFNKKQPGLTASYNIIYNKLTEESYLTKVITYLEYKLLKKFDNLDECVEALKIEYTLNDFEIDINEGNLFKKDDKKFPILSPYYYEELLKSGCEHNKPNKVRSALEYGANVNEPHAAYRAVKNCSVDAFKVLLEYDLDLITDKSHNVCNELLWSIESCTEIAKLIINTGKIDLNVIENYYFRKSVEYDNIEIARLLLEKGIKKSIFNYFYGEVVDKAISNNSIEMIKLFIEYGCEISTRISGFMLNYAVKNNDKSVIDFMINNGLDFSRWKYYIIINPEKAEFLIDNYPDSLEYFEHYLTPEQKEKYKGLIKLRDDFDIFEGRTLPIPRIPKDYYKPIDINKLVKNYLDGELSDVYHNIRNSFEIAFSHNIKISPPFIKEDNTMIVSSSINKSWEKHIDDLKDLLERNLYGLFDIEVTTEKTFWKIKIKVKVTPKEEMIKMQGDFDLFEGNIFKKKQLKPSIEKPSQIRRVSNQLNDKEFEDFYEEILEEFGKEILITEICPPSYQSNIIKMRIRIDNADVIKIVGTQNWTQSSEEIRMNMIFDIISDSMSKIEYKYNVDFDIKDIDGWDYVSHDITLYVSNIQKEFITLQKDFDIFSDD